ncbi:endolytic transglycosylase MltG [Georgenia sp. TF02-10]|uniref:endolytic transglycosylase MltG n=1 Tax=Georgenia sp. TF02-10 TaxID=2917725 RepID=UPI001FA80B6C|nr:endolytic transglycosylase MltG [Georgenia sp. TF02-10]UNX53245.1 endolytic transglycosylase MltG [Georgenia sp. TF02-10]
MNDLFEETPGTPAAPPADDPRRQRRAQQVRQQRRRRRTTVIILVTVAVVALLAVWAVPQVRGLFDLRPAGAEDYPGPGSGSVEVVVPAGASGTEIGTVLHDDGVVASVRAFTDAFAENVNAARIQPGTYTLKREMAARDAVTALLDPANKSEVTITVPEGFHARQVYERIENVAQIPLAEVQAAAADPAAIGLPAEAGGNPEGWLAAATYRFEPDDDAATILAAMVAQTVARLDALQVPADQRQEVLTKASIVEREVGPEYYGQTARVIENRLAGKGDTGGRLQMDSTVLYGLDKVGGVPTSEELDKDTPYNTYLHPGLPPTPIGAPGEAAVAAVLAPPEGDWLYFTTVNLDTGETKFTADYAQQQEFVAELRAWVQENEETG